MLMMKFGILVLFCELSASFIEIPRLLIESTHRVDCKEFVRWPLDQRSCSHKNERNLCLFHHSNLRAEISCTSSESKQQASWSRRQLISSSLFGFAASLTAAEASAKEADQAAFYAKWPYAQASDILPFVYANAKKGDIDAILAALDEFGTYYPMYKLGDEKGRLLELELSKLPRRPKVCVELGTFFGYSAIRTGRWLDPGAGKLYCIEFNPDHADVASKVIEHAGLDDKVEILVGAASDVLPKVAGRIGHADFVLLDHAKDAYLSDLLAMEALGVVGPGTLVAADNVVYPGAPGFLEHVQGGGRYETRLVEAKFEYDLVWKAGWSPKADALSFSYCVR